MPRLAFALLPSVVALALVLPAARAQEPVAGPPWKRDYQEARREALRTGRPLFVYATQAGSPEGEIFEREVLTQADLEPAYQTAVWLWVWRDLSGSESDKAAERVALRFGIEIYPEHVLVDPASLAEIARLAGDMKDVLKAFQDAVSKIKKPADSVKALSAKMAKARELIAAGSVPQARAELEPLAKGKDPYDFANEARSLLRGLPDAPAVKLEDRLEDPDPEIRLAALDEFAANPRGAPEAFGKLPPMMQDPDRLVRLRAVDAVRKAAPKDISGKALELLKDPWIPFRTAVLRALREARDPEAFPAIAALTKSFDLTKKGQVEMVKAAIEAISTCGDASAIELLRPIAQAGRLDGTSKHAVDALPLLARRLGDKGAAAAARVLLESFPKAAEGLPPADLEPTMGLAQAVHLGLANLNRGKGPDFPAEWTAATREALHAEWKPLVDKMK